MKYEDILGLWKARRANPFASPEDLLERSIAYFRWCEDNPLQEEEVYVHRGVITRVDKSKARAFTKKGLATFLGITTVTFSSYRHRGEDWAEVVDLIEQVIYTQKFENAAANLLNAGIVARDLGLAERSEVTGANGGPVRTADVTDEEKILDEARRLGIPLEALGLGGGDAQGAGAGS